MPEAGKTAQVAATEAFQQGDGLRTLQGQQHSVSFAVGNRQPCRLHPLTDPGGIGFSAGGIDHQDQGAPFVVDGTAVVNDQIVTDAAPVIEQNRVAGFPRADAVKVGGDELLQSILGLGPSNRRTPIWEMSNIPIRSRTLCVPESIR